MNISEFLAEEMTRGARFLTYWLEQHQEDPDEFSLDMPVADWLSAYTHFKDHIIHSLVVISPETIQAEMKKAHAEGRLDTYHALSNGDVSSLLKSTTVTGRMPSGKPNMANYPKSASGELPDRETVISHQNWDVISVLDHAERFIEGLGMDDEFDSYLREMARQENEGV